MTRWSSTTLRSLAVAAALALLVIASADGATPFGTDAAKTAAPVTIDGTQATNANGTSRAFMRADAKPATLYTASGTGSVARTFAAKLGDTVSVKDFGAVGDGVTDDTAAIQAAVDSSYRNGNGINKGKIIELGAGSFKVTSGLKLDVSGLGSDHGIFRGAGMESSTILWYGPANQSAITMVGAFQTLADFSIADMGTGWLGGIDYEGVSGVSRSTAGTIARVHINCLSLPGDGIQLGPGGAQADALLVEHAYIEGCTSGTGLKTFNGNVLSINLLALTMNNNWIHVNRGVTTNINIIGGEYDSCGVLLQDGAGGALSMQGVRSEGCKRQYATPSGSAPRNVSISAHTMASQNQARTGTIATTAASTAVVFSATGMCIPGDDIAIQDDVAVNSNTRRTISTCSDPTHGVMSGTAVSTNSAAAWGLLGTGTCAITSGTATLTCTGQPNFPVGQGITIAGAGAAGAVLNTSILSCSSSTVCTLNANASTTVTTAKMAAQNFFPGQEQTPFYFQGGGTFRIASSHIQTEYDVRIQTGEVLLDSVNFDSASLCSSNPWGNSASFGAGGYVNTYCNASGTPTRFPDTSQSPVRFASGDNKGSAALSGGTKAITVAATGVTKCICQDVTTPANTCSGVVAATTLTLTGTGTDTVTYLCL